MNEQDRIQRALDIARRYGGIDGAHHKDWVIDQMVRALCGCEGEPLKENFEYLDFVSEACDGEDGPNTYDWDEGIAP